MDIILPLNRYSIFHAFAQSAKHHYNIYFDMRLMRIKYVEYCATHSKHEYNVEKQIILDKQKTIDQPVCENTFIDFIWNEYKMQITFDKLSIIPYVPICKKSNKDYGLLK